MATTAESLYPARPGNISPLLHRIAVPVFAVLMVFSTLGAAIVLSLSMALHVGRRLLERIPASAPAPARSPPPTIARSRNSRTGY